MRTFPDSRQAPPKRTHSTGLQPNNFDIMRLVLALTVVVAHCRILSQSASLGVIGAPKPRMPEPFSSRSLTSVNGALWTVEEDVSVYVCLQSIAWFCRRYGWPKADVRTFVLRLGDFGPIHREPMAPLSRAATAIKNSPQLPQKLHRRCAVG